MTSAITFIGFGEAAGTIVSGWNGAPGGGAATGGQPDPGAGASAVRAHDIRAYDVKTDDPASAAAMRARYADHGVTGCATAAEAMEGAHLVFSTVTADRAVAAAEACAPHLTPGCFWFDLNSCAPSSKARAATLLDAVGARYVDVAVMAPVHPRRNLVPLLVAGPHAARAAVLLAALPMAPRVVEGPVGAASSIKMIRSVMVKGLEALTAEYVLAAVAAGVETEVLGSLGVSHKGTDWPGRAAYNLERMIVHGERRAAEMAEVARTLDDLGLPADMARATVAWQDRIGRLRLEAPDEAAGYGEAARLLLPHLRKG